MKNNVTKLLLAGALIATTAQATEMRTPWISAQGPIRYTFEKLHADKYNLNWWSVVHAKEAHKAFLKHGTKTQHLSALIFNKADFTLNEIFPNSEMPIDSENFNPFVNITTIHPRVSYTEHGMTVGARWDYPIWKNKGRIGLRATVPFRRIEMEREDNCIDEQEDPAAQFVSRQQVRVFTTHGGGDGAAAAANVVATAYRMDLIGMLRALDPANNPQYIIAKPTVGNGVVILNNQVGVDVTTALANADNAPVALVTTNQATGKPFDHAWQLGDGAGGRDTSVANAVFQRAAIAIQNPDFSTNLPNQATPLITVFDNNVGTNYANTFPTVANPSGSTGFAQNAPNTWLIFRRQTNNGAGDGQKFGNGANGQSGVGLTVYDGIEDLLKQYNENAFAFFNKQGYNFATDIRSGLGDIDLDLFYEHTFNQDWMGELALGVRFPTRGDQDKYGNPYKAILGNGDHFELKIAALLAYQPFTWMNIKADASYSFVLENTEHRIAAFKGSKIKNIGPRADADVDWGYFVGHLDLNFFHPKTSAIRSTLGYEFYYKTEDHLTFKKSQAESFLGKKFVGGALVANLKDLDNNAARKNTESIAHKIRSSTSFQVNEYFEIFAGGSATFAGQNVMRDRDFHGGFNIRY